MRMWVARTGDVPLHSSAANESHTAPITRPTALDTTPSRELIAAAYHLHVEYDWTDEWHA